MFRRRYADTLEAVAERGVEAFYRGPIAEAMVQALSAAGGGMTVRDLEGYRVVHRETVGVRYRGGWVRGCSAPGGGAVVGSVLNVYGGFKGGDTGVRAQRLVESMKFAYGQVSLCLVGDEGGVGADRG